MKREMIFAAGTVILWLGLYVFVRGVWRDGWRVAKSIDWSSHASPRPPVASVPAPAPMPPPEPPIVLARREIPGIVSRVYAALDDGNPLSLRPVLSERAKNDFQVFDAICKPYTYRAHYIENIIERPENRFEVRVRVLVKPTDERAYVLVFVNKGGSFVLDAVGDPPESWFAEDKERAIEVARQFVYAAKAGKADVLSKLAPAGMDVTGFVTDKCWRQFFYDVGDVRAGAELESFKGLKVKVTMNLDLAGVFGWKGIGSSYFYVERVEDDYKIVAADPRGNTFGFYMPLEGCRDLTHFAKVEDPNLEARTLARFNLQGGN